MTANPPSSPNDRRSGEEPEVASAKSPQPSSERFEEKEKELSEPEEREPAQDESDNEEGEVSAPPLPDEEVPPLPNEAPPGKVEDDGWEPVWDANASAYYFYNRFTGVSQWENPRVPDAPSVPPGVDGPATAAPATKPPVTGGYNPAIHGDYDPTAPYAQQYEPSNANASAAAPGTDPSAMYTATGAFNRFTGRWQAEDLNPERYNDENKARRQMHAFFDVDAAANSHDGRSLKAERSAKKLTKKELKAFKEKRRERKEEKRRAWLRD